MNWFHVMHLSLQAAWRVTLCDLLWELLLTFLSIHGPHGRHVQIRQHESAAGGSVSIEQYA